MAVALVHNWSGSWSVTDQNSVQPPVNHTLQVNVSSVTAGNWLVAAVGWHSVPGVPATVSVGDDACNQWIPIATSAGDSLPSFPSSPTPLNDNTCFSSGVSAPWTIVGGAVSTSITQRFGIHPFSAQITPNGTSSNVTFTSERVPITAFRNQELAGSAYLWFTNATGNFHGTLSWFNSAGTLISTSTGITQGASAQTWIQVQVLGSAPSTATTATFSVVLPGTPPRTQVVYVDEAQMVVPDVLNLNAGFESGSVGWGNTGCTIAVATNVVNTGTRSLKVTPTGTLPIATVQDAASPVTAMNFYTVSAWVNAPAGYANSLCFISWLAGSSFISNTFAPSTSLQPGVWTQISAVAQAPATATRAQVGVQLLNSPQPFDVVYVDDVTLTAGNGFSAGTRVALWAAPNVLSPVTTISIAPLGQVTAMGAVVTEFSGLPTWLDTDALLTQFNDNSATVNVSVTPTRPDFVVAFGASNNGTYPMNRVHTGWQSPSFTVSTTNGVDTLGDLNGVFTWQTTSSAITGQFYGPDAINSNPIFATNVTGWQAVNGTLAFSSTVGLFNSHSALLTPNGTSTTVTAQITHSSSPSVTAGNSYLGQAYVAAISPPTTSAAVHVSIEWLTAAHATISTISSADIAVPSQAAPGNFFNMIVQGVAPTTAAFASLHVTMDGHPAASRTLNIGQGTITKLTGASSDVAAAIAAFQLTPATVPTQPSSTWPNVRLRVAFGQPASTPPSELAFVDISNRLFSVTTDRGRQYELNALEAGEADFVLRNDDGFLTPENTSSPYPLDVYNPYQLTAQWNGRQYSIMAGYMERWPNTWADAHYGLVTAGGTDSYAMVTKTLNTVLQSEILLDQPFGYWPCTDPEGSSAAVNIGVSPAQTPLVQTQSSTLGGSSSSASFGSDAITLVGDSGTCWSCVNVSTTTSHGFSLVYDGPPLPLIANGVTVTGWCRVTGGSSFPSHTALFTAVGKNGPIIQLWMNGGTALQVTTWNANTGVSTDSAATANGFANINFQFARTWNTTSWSLTLDNFITGGNHLSGTNTMASTWSHFELNGRNDSFNNQSAFFDCSFAHVAVFDRTLNASRLITYLFAGTDGLAGDAGDGRISRLISYMTWSPPTRLHYEGAHSVVAGATDIGGSDIGSAINNIVTSEQALLYVDRNSYLTYRNRGSANARGVRATLGEDTDAGELPYRVTLEIDFDPQYIQNDIQTTHLGTPTWSQSTGTGSGSTNVSIIVTNPGSANKYADRSQQITSYLDTVAESVNLTNYLAAQYSQPLMRVAQVELNPAARPSMFATLLALDIGDRVILNRRPVGAPLIELDVVIIGIHHDIEAKSGRWLVKLDIMPTSIAALQVKTLTLNSPTLGHLDAGNVVGWA